MVRSGYVRLVLVMSGYVMLCQDMNKLDHVSSC